MLILVCELLNAGAEHTGKATCCLALIKGLKDQYDKVSFDRFSSLLLVRSRCRDFPHCLSFSIQ